MPSRELEATWELDTWAVIFCAMVLQIQTALSESRLRGTRPLFNTLSCIHCDSTLSLKATIISQSGILVSSSSPGPSTLEQTSLHETFLPRGRTPDLNAGNSDQLSKHHHPGLWCSVVKMTFNHSKCQYQARLLQTMTQSQLKSTA